MIDHDAIQAQAKRIMDDFLKELGEVKQEEHFGVEREKEMREPKAVEKDPNFSQAFLANAPRTKDGLLLAEKKQW